MNWAHHAILKLHAGEQATINPRGYSMKGRVESGDTVVVAPVPFDDCPCCDSRELDHEPEWCECCGGDLRIANLSVNDIVLVKVNGKVYLHLISKIEGPAYKRRYMIANNRGHENGWVKPAAIYGVAISVAGKVVKVLSSE